MIAEENFQELQKAGLDSHAAKDYGKAVDFLTRALALRPKDVTTLRGLADALVASGDTAAAIERYDAALKIDPNDSASWIGKGDAFLKIADYRSALISYDTVAKINPESFGASEWTIRADRVADKSEAIQFYDRGTAANPKYFWAWKGKGQALRDIQKLDEALESFQQALKIDESNPDLWVDTGNVYFDRPDYAQALVCYEKALELDPENSFAWVNKGVVAERRRDYAEAIKLYDKALEIDPKNGQTWLAKGWSLGELGNAQEAIKSYERAIELSPGSLWAYNNKGRMLVKLNELPQALEFFERAVEIDKSESLPWLNKSSVLQNLGRLDEARKCLEEALLSVRKTQRHDVLTNLGVMLSEYFHDNEAALKLFEEVMVLKPTLETRANIAEGLIKLGRYGEGRKYALAVEHDSEDINLRRIMGYLVMVSHALEGNTAESIGRFSKVAEGIAGNTANQGIAQTSDWNYSGLEELLKQSSLDPYTKFVLLTLIDIQVGRIALSNTSFFKKPEPAKTLIVPPVTP